MATTLYLTDAASPFSLSGVSLPVKVLSLSRGSGKVSLTTTSDALANDGVPAVWVMQVNAVTLNAVQSFNCWGLESNAMANYGPLVSAIQRYNSDGSTTSPGYCSSWVNWPPPTEWGTSAAVRTATANSIANAPFAYTDGQLLAISFSHSAVGTAASGYTLTFDYGAASAGVDGDTYITFPETITQYSAPAGAGLPDITNLAPINVIARASRW